ncbi:MAG TPA: hypothetical protein VFB22_01800 [Candidatus Baltobacteraceae bacterium]|nr:hypothetical protein [Candidatus Baltobacteraceae bacterium]
MARILGRIADVARSECNTKADRGWHNRANGRLRALGNVARRTFLEYRIRDDERAEHHRSRDDLSSEKRDAVGRLSEAARSVHGPCKRAFHALVLSGVHFVSRACGHWV